MSRIDAIWIVVEVNPDMVTDEELNTVKDLCEDTQGKMYRIVTFALDSVGIEEILNNLKVSRARISYIKDGNGSPNEWKHYQVEEILPVEIAID